MYLLCSSMHASVPVSVMAGSVPNIVMWAQCVQHENQNCSRAEAIRPLTAAIV